MQDADGLQAAEAPGQAPNPPNVRLTPEAFAKHPGGVRRTALGLLGALREAGARVSVSPFAERATTQTSPTPSPLKRALLQASETAYFARQRLHRHPGIAHSLYYDQHVRAADWPLVVTVHDMIHERFDAGSAGLRWAKRLAVQRAALIVTPSRATASEVTAYFPDVGAKLITIPWGISQIFLEDAPDRGLAYPDRPFLLFVGARSGYKNLALLIRALESASDLDELRLVLAGGEPLLEPERSALTGALGNGERLVHLTSPTDEELRGLYDSAAVTAVTSRCEGFGLPVLEAMARGCPVVCADGHAASEVASGHAVTFSPDSAPECAAAIRQALASSRADRESAREHARRFTWAVAARSHIDAYRSLNETLQRRGRVEGSR
jgi:glycosyltransferase involved in cell wall biosynthesis